MNINAQVTHLLAVVLGVASTVTGVTNTVGVADGKILAVGGIATVAISTVSKLWHDGGVTQAQLDNGVKIAEPELAKIVSFVETEWPGAKQTLTNLDTRINSVVSSTSTRIAQVEDAIKPMAAIVKLVTSPAPVPAPLPAPPTAPVA